ncbi:MAG: cell division protein ZapA [Pseudomonadota bacterium]|jgi:cell division protein ZapA|nr:cell division protein ZapA [Rhodovulum sp.]MCI5086242.1 cell division protein ZapA [Rhodovulum sp.]MEC8631332.1 cell division protein ZapA [Pseudomonadota bacterium]MEE3317700.1 cell division protein ZapA [Pseudomonadota bacterium]|tara:strand:- start:501 stop:896 length:396 start_codon:yes stop_codon:yes gene_type:complete
MPEVQITIGGRSFEVACQEGEESFLQSAAALLDNEASTLVSQIGRLPEARMLLMAGLMLADKTAGLEEKLKTVQARLDDSQNQISELKAKPAPEPTKVEVPVIPQALLDSMAELAARSESLADEIEERAGA